jgi:hypothetical protein
MARSSRRRPRRCLARQVRRRRVPRWTGVVARPLLRVAQHGIGLTQALERLVGSRIRRRSRRASGWSSRPAPEGGGQAFGRGAAIDTECPVEIVNRRADRHLPIVLLQRGADHFGDGDGPRCRADRHVGDGPDTGRATLHGGGVGEIERRRSEPGRHHRDREVVLEVRRPLPLELRLHHHHVEVAEDHRGGSDRMNAKNVCSPRRRR